MSILRKLFGSNPKRQKIPDNIAYVIWSCLDDKDSCDACRAMEGTYWVPEANIPLPPLASCQSSEKCRCLGVYVLKDESGALQTAAFIRSCGGKVTAQEMERYESRKRMRS